MPRVLTIGTFDRLHDGHRDLLRYAWAIAGREAEGGRVVVGINSAPMVWRTKGVRVPDPAERGRALMDLPAGTRPSGWATNPQGGDHPSVLPLLAGGPTGRPNVLLVGSDWAKPRKYLKQIGVTWADLERLRITLAFAPRPADGPSSTKLRAAGRTFRPGVRTIDAAGQTEW